MRTSFKELLKEKVEIPIIQRDYAQGRKDDKSTKIRKDFLTALFEFIAQLKDGQKELELDFIYGFNEHPKTENQTFIPIDGQQRITTLWLIHWFISAKEKVAIGDKSFLRNFTYETRHSTTQFCNELVDFEPEFSMDKISLEIKNQPWYFETWNFDSSIQAMLVVLDDIQDKYNNLDSLAVWPLIGCLDSPFFFYKLDMDNVGLTDDLYIKMNSRGKPLTEFEYFKAGFTELISDLALRKRFEEHIDSSWMDSVWSLVIKSEASDHEKDVALEVDKAFLNLFNFITSVIAFKADLRSSTGQRYINTIHSEELLKLIYGDQDNQILLFDLLDACSNQIEQDFNFWTNTFYYRRDEFNQAKTRLFYSHNDVDLLKRCLLHYDEFRGFSFPEQLLLHASLVHLQQQTEKYCERIRIVRNIVANSENELRDTTLGRSFEEVEHFIINGDVSVFENFKTDQISEEEAKLDFLSHYAEFKTLLIHMEDCEIFRGSISILPFNEKFGERSLKFLELFDESQLSEDFKNRSNLLLCFGDYSQKNGTLSNLISPSRTVIRSFFTSPGYNKDEFITKTQAVVCDCLDEFQSDVNSSISAKIKSTLSDYVDTPKDWKYYFLKYPSFREDCTQGYYQFTSEEYVVWKLRVTQFNGKHWDPFLYEVHKNNTGLSLQLESYGNKMQWNVNGVTISIVSRPTGFLFEQSSEVGTSSLVSSWIQSGELETNGILAIKQAEGIDLEDRVERLNAYLQAHSKILQ